MIGGQFGIGGHRGVLGGLGSEEEFAVAVSGEVDLAITVAGQKSVPGVDEDALESTADGFLMGRGRVWSIVAGRSGGIFGVEKGKEFGSLDVHVLQQPIGRRVEHGTHGEVRVRRVDPLRNVENGSSVVQRFAIVQTELLEQHFVLHFGESDGDSFESHLGLLDGDFGLGTDLLQLGGSSGHIRRFQVELEAGS